MFLKILILIGLIVFSLIGGVYISISSIFLNTNINPEKTLWGIFGDSVGGILNPTLTFFSFIAILVTIYIQNQELSATRKELKRSAEAQEKNIEKLEIQIEAQKQQQFENLFFKMLETFESISNNLSNIKILKQVPLDEYSYQNIEVLYIDDLFKKINNSKLAPINISRQRLHFTNDIHGRYFIFLYQILKFIFVSNAEISDEALQNKEELKSEILTKKNNPKRKVLLKYNKINNSRKLPNINCHQLCDR